MQILRKVSTTVFFVVFFLYPNEKTARSANFFTRLKTTIIQAVRSPHVVIKKKKKKISHFKMPTLNSDVTVNS